MDALRDRLHQRIQVRELQSTLILWYAESYVAQQHGFLPSAPGFMGEGGRGVCDLKTIGILLLLHGRALCLFGATGRLWCKMQQQRVRHSRQVKQLGLVFWS